MAGKLKQGNEGISDLGDLFSEERLGRKTVTHKKVREPKVWNGESLPWGVQTLIQEKIKDPTLKKNWEKVGEEGDCSKPYFMVRDKVLLRVSRNIWDKDEESNEITQIVVPTAYRQKILKMGHENIFSGQFWCL